MKYIVSEKPGKFSINEKKAPQRFENEALLKVNKEEFRTDIHGMRKSTFFIP